jgi:RNA polymerase sigma factor (sigma-70 family)
MPNEQLAQALDQSKIDDSQSSGTPAVDRQDASTKLLIGRIQQGDEAARNELFDRYLLPVLFLVRVNLGRRLRAKLESWDIVQEVFVKSLNDLASFRYECDGAFRRHLSLIVMQVIRDKADFWRAAKRDPSREEPVAADHDSCGLPWNELPDRYFQSPSALLSLDDDLNHLADSLDVLAEESPDAWEVIVAVKLVGQSLKDVADELGTTPDAVKMRLRRGMAKLAKIYRTLQS